MKKLLTMMTAVALGTCAWATESSAVTLLNENFNAWANGTYLEYMTALPEGLWSYSGTLAENELKVVAEAEGDKALSLNTGSKVLNAKFAAEAQTIPADTGYYFTSKVTFKDPSDTLPTLGVSDKFALVVLDNIESVDAGYTTTPDTNLWIIAKYGESGKRAYQLDVAVTEDWLETEHTVVVKAYNNVMASGTCAGFLVKVDNTDDDTVCKVVASYAIDDKGVINYGVSCSSSKWNDSADVTTTGDLGYLGYAQTAIAGSVRQRYVDGELLLSNVPGDSTLASVDFQGQGKIDDVSLATTGADFGADSLVLTVEKTAGITFGEDTESTMYYGSGESVTITFKVDSTYELESPTGLTPDENGLYTWVYTPTANNEVVKISAFKPVAEFNGTSYKSVALALQAAVESGAAATITLKDSVTFGAEENYGLTISSGDITINLNGKTIQGGGTDEIGVSSATITVYGGTLKIVDTAENGGGQVLAPNFSEEVIGPKPYAIAATAGMTTIEGGKIGLINGYDATLTLVGGTYTDVGATFYWGATEKTYGNKTYTATLTDSVWAVAEKVIVKYTVSATYDNTQVSVTDLTTGEVEANTVLSFSVAALTGFENVVVKAGDTVLPLENGKYTWTVVANVTITITADAVVVGPSIDDKEGEIVVDEQTGNATIDTTSATVTVTGMVTGDVIVPPSVGTVHVTLDQGKTVKVCFDGKEITGAFTVSSANGTTTIVLNENGSVNGVSVKPEMAAAGDGDEEMKAPLEVGTDVAVGVKTIPGLKYQLIRSDAPNGTFGDVPGASATGTGDPVKLEDKNKPSGKAFYKIKVSQR